MEEKILDDFNEDYYIESEPMNFIPEELDKIPHAKDYSNCPNCGEQSNPEPHLTKVYQEEIDSIVDWYSGRSLARWIEVHRCWNCKTLFKFENGIG